MGLSALENQKVLWSICGQAPSGASHGEEPGWAWQLGPQLP